MDIHATRTRRTLEDARGKVRPLVAVSDPGLAAPRPTHTSREEPIAPKKPCPAKRPVAAGCV
jgi:hypothetical protein